MNRSCEICGSNHRVLVYKGQIALCHNHYEQRRMRDKRTWRSKYDLNEIIIHENYAEIIICNKNCEKIAGALIDIEDVEKVKSYKWCLTTCNYVINRSFGRLHRLIMNAPKGIQIDHRNGNPLDNRKSNLRLCTQSENMYNADRKPSITSGVRGIYWDASRNKWYTSISVNCKTIYLGRFDNLRDAIKARKEAEQKYHGEFAYANRVAV